MLAFDSGPPLRMEGLAKEERRSLPTPARLFDRRSLLTPAHLSGRKAWPKRYNARFQLRPTSPIGDAPNLCLQLFSDLRSRSRLGPTDQGRPLGGDPGNRRSK